MMFVGGGEVLMTAYDNIPDWKYLVLKQSDRSMYSNKLLSWTTA